jgi:hypothetical protein
MNYKWKLAMTASGIALVVVTVLMVNGSVQGSHRAEPEGRLKTLELALESYHIDHNSFPSDSATDNLIPNSTFDPVLYVPASAVLYRALSGDADGDAATTSPEDGKSYFSIDPSWIRTVGKITYFVDSWGNGVGYSTNKAAFPDRTGGNNSTFDIWFTGGAKNAKGRDKWVTNW